MNSIIESADYLVEQSVLSFKRNLEQALQSCETEHQETILQVFNDRWKPFEGLETEFLQTSFIKKNFNYVTFEEILLGKTLSRKKVGHKRLLFQKEECFVYIPLLDSLKQLLGNKRIRSLILKPPTNAPDFITMIYAMVHYSKMMSTSNYIKKHWH